MYLWVLVSNESVSWFYEWIGGDKVEEIMMDNFGGGVLKVWWYVWWDFDCLIGEGCW